MARYQDPYNLTAPQGGVDLTPTPAPSPYAAPRPPAHGPPQTPRYPTLPQPQYGQPGYRAPQFPGYQPTQQFAADPTTSNFEQLMNFHIPYYMQPVQQTNYLAQGMPQYQQLQQTISSLLPMLGQASPGESMLLSLAGALAGGGNADAYANEYRNQLKQEPFTGAEAEAYKAEFSDPLASQRDQALARTMREVSDQGIDPSSGIAQAKMALTRAEYDKALAAAQNDFAINANQLRSQRQGQAFQAGLSAEELKQRGLSSAMSGASGAGNLFQNRLAQMLQTAGFGNEAAMDRARMGYGVDQNLRGEQYQNFGTAAALARMMADLPSQRQQEALQLIATADPQSMMSMTNAEAGQRLGQSNSANAAYGNTWGGLGSIMGYFNSMFPTAMGGGASYNDPGFTTNYLPFNPYGPG